MRLESDLAAVPAKEPGAREVNRVEAVTRMRGEILALRKRGYSWQEVAAMVSSEGCRVAAATFRTELSRRARAVAPAKPSAPRRGPRPRHALVDLWSAKTGRSEGGHMAPSTYWVVAVSVATLWQ